MMHLKEKRYTQLPLPVYRYVPGEGVHPKYLKKGEHVPEFSPKDGKLSADTWQECKRYLYAIDLFNAEFWWEAHEVLEDLWFEVGRGSPVAHFIQGIIQISAALLKDEQSMTQPAARLVRDGFEKMSAQSGVFLGIEIDILAEEVKKYFLNQGAPVPKIILTQGK